ncbi:prepilin-type N-terminal cleavage/methylation domain-containing protein [Oceanobacter mangrovi]|uniref:prepilin-type N-terminal cleavage/methylation domain-containing protein n=1 Tax=Oceanobacter mangrovi TaxID=2862510 RepID=UPI001C8F07F1|nr:prepilin-type N-terminal cleavage/methylation domain-containing protein [Oceanobacter mangrovi]
MRRLRPAGFTLIELVMTIVISAIIGLISMRFVSTYVQGWVDTSARVTLSGTAWVASEQLVRQIREALPHSVRSFTDGGNACLELVPVIAAADYLSLPKGNKSTSIEVVEVSGVSVGTSAWISVYPNSENSVYGNSGPGNSISTAAATLGAVNNHVQTLTFPTAQSFPNNSPVRRLFLISQPIAYCEDGSGRLWRYANYGFAKDSTGLLPASDAVLMLDNILPGSLRFGLAAAQLQRNSIVHVEFRTLRAARDGNQTGSTGEQLQINREVQLINVP